MKSFILANIATLLAAGAALAGNQAPVEPVVDTSSGGDVAVLLVVLLGALIVATTVNKPKPPGDGSGQ